MISSLASILRGAAHALRNPRRLATLAAEPAGEREEAYQREATALFGGVPRSVPFEGFLNSRGDALSAFTFLDDTSTVADLLLLRALVSRYGARTMLEIGTFRGESALAVASAGANVVTLSLPDEVMLARNAEPSWVEAHRTQSAGHPNITHAFGDSAVLDTNPYREWADILFIDGDHSRGAIEVDTRRFWDTRSRRVGAVVWHDAFFSPLVPRWEVLAGIAAGVPAVYRSQIVHVSNTLCLAWLPDGDSMPSVSRSYVPRVVYSVNVAPVLGWTSSKQPTAELVPPIPREAPATSR